MTSATHRIRFMYNVKNIGVSMMCIVLKQSKVARTENEKPQINNEKTDQWSRDVLNKLDFVASVWLKSRGHRILISPVPITKLYSRESILWSDGGKGGGGGEGGGCCLRSGWGKNISLSTLFCN